MSFEKSFSEALRYFHGRLVLEDPERAEDPQHRSLRILLPDIQSLPAIDLRQHIAQKLQELLAVDGVEDDDIIVLAERLLIELIDQVLELLTHVEFRSATCHGKNVRYHAEIVGGFPSQPVTARYSCQVSPWLLERHVMFPRG